MGGFRKASIYAPRNVSGICAQPHNAKEDNASPQVTLAQLMNFTNGQFNNSQEEREVGNRQTNLLEQKIMDMRKVMSEKTIESSELKSKPRDWAKVKSKRV